MGDTNYFSGIVKILEKPLQNFNQDKFMKAVFQVELYQTRQNKIVSIIFWGNLANEITSYYHINDYILIEGYSSINFQSLKGESKPSVELIITVLKVYPVFLNSKDQRRKD